MVTHPILATSRNPDSGLRAHAVPCPSLPASPTLSPALSTWHTWARGDWRHSPPLWGTKGRGRVGSRCHIPPPSLLSSLPSSHRCCPGLCPLLCPPLGQLLSLEHCGSVVASAAHSPAAAGCVLPALRALGHPWYHSWLLPSTWPTGMGEVGYHGGHTGDAPLPTCRLHCLPTGFCTTQLFPRALLGLGQRPFAVQLVWGSSPFCLASCYGWQQRGAWSPSGAMPGCCSAVAPDRSGVGGLGGCWCWWWGVGRALQAANCCLAGDTEGVIMGGLRESAAWPGSPQVPLLREWRGSGSIV